MNKVYYVSASPWKGSPFKCSLVVLTKNGTDEVIKLLREFYKNESLEPEEMTEVPFLKGEIDEPGTGDQSQSTLS
uniref:Uncharacterized protein n=1 Tax=viral metagenome TaxID=1070528 RepID=A0A6M3JG91_9ZZZZ